MDNADVLDSIGNHLAQEARRHLQTVAMQEEQQLMAQQQQQQQEQQERQRQQQDLQLLADSKMHTEQTVTPTNATEALSINHPLDVDHAMEVVVSHATNGVEADPEHHGPMMASLNSAIASAMASSQSHHNSPLPSTSTGTASPISAHEQELSLRYDKCPVIIRWPATEWENWLNGEKTHCRWNLIRYRHRDMQTFTRGPSASQWTREFHCDHAGQYRNRKDPKLDEKKKRKRSGSIKCGCNASIKMRKQFQENEVVIEYTWKHNGHVPSLIEDIKSFRMPQDLKLWVKRRVNEGLDWKRVKAMMTSNAEELNELHPTTKENIKQLIQVTYAHFANSARLHSKTNGQSPSSQSSERGGSSAPANQLSSAVDEVIQSTSTLTHTEERQQSQEQRRQQHTQISRQHAQATQLQAEDPWRMLGLNAPGTSSSHTISDEHVRQVLQRQLTHDADRTLAVHNLGGLGSTDQNSTVPLPMDTDTPGDQELRNLARTLQESNHNATRLDLGESSLSTEISSLHKRKLKEFQDSPAITPTTESTPGGLIYNNTNTLIHTTDNSTSTEANNTLTPDPAPQSAPTSLDLASMEAAIASAAVSISPSDPISLIPSPLETTSTVTSRPAPTSMDTTMTTAIASGAPSTPLPVSTPFNQTPVEAVAVSAAASDSTPMEADIAQASESNRQSSPTPLDSASLEAVLASASLSHSATASLDSAVAKAAIASTTTSAPTSHTDPIPSNTTSSISPIMTNGNSNRVGNSSNCYPLERQQASLAEQQPKDMLRDILGAIRTLHDRMETTDQSCTQEEAVQIIESFALPIRLLKEALERSQ